MSVHRYEGSFAQGKREGLGRMLYPDGKGAYVILTGEFRDDKLAGSGSLEYPDGERYEVLSHFTVWCASRPS